MVRTARRGDSQKLLDDVGVSDSEDDLRASLGGDVEQDMDDDTDGAIGRLEKRSSRDGSQIGELEIDDGSSLEPSARDADLAHMTRLRIVGLNISWFGVCVIWFLLVIQVVPSQVQAIVGDSGKGSALGATVALGAVVTVVLSPLMGMLSDRSTLKWGRRRSFMVCGVVVMCVFMVGMALVNTTILVEETIGCAADDSSPASPTPSPMPSPTATTPNNASLLATISPTPTPTGSADSYSPHGSFGLYIFMNVVMTGAYVVFSVPYNGLMADKTPSHLRGFNSGVMGMLTTVGNLVGAGIGIFYVQIGVLGTYIIMIAITVVTLAITCATIPEKAHSHGGKPKPKLTVRSVFWGYIEPLRDHDFRWVFFTRFLMQQGVSTVQYFLKYWMQDAVQLPSCMTADRAVSIFFLPMLITASISALISGWLSDRWGRRRKPFVIGAGMLMCVTCAAMAGVRTYYPTIVLSLMFGVGYGAFLALDFALVMDVLPADRDNAKDMAVWHNALVLPQMLSTPIGGVIRDQFQKIGCGEECGLGYVVLFSITALYFFLGSVFVVRIRGVR